MIYYHNPRCSKSREGLKLLEASGKIFEIKEYLKTGLTKKEIQTLIKNLEHPVEQLIRTKEKIFQENGFDKNKLSATQVVKILAEFPELLERPILLSQDQAIIGRPPERLAQLLKK